MRFVVVSHNAPLKKLGKNNHGITVKNLRANPHKNQTKSNFFGKALKLNFAPLLHIASP